MTTALDSALAYAGRGWPVFPVTPPPNKKPLNEHGFKEATTDHDQIIEWWTKWPSAQVGVACGEAGIMSVDLDEKPRQWISGKASLDTIGIDADCACSLIMGTPRNGGRQLFYSAYNTRRMLNVLPGVDLLGDGGYTIVPSPASPNREWLVGDPFDLDDLDPMPEWVADLLQGAKPKSTAAKGEKGEVELTGDQRQDIWAALDYIPNDDRGDWIKVGMALKSTGAGDEAYQMWVSWSESSPKFNAKDQRYQWDRLHELRADGSEVTINSLFYMANEHGYGPAPEATPEIVIRKMFNEDREATGAAVKEALAKTAEILAEKETEDETLPDRPPLEARGSIDLADWDEVAELPPIEWQVESLLPRSSLAVIAGDTEAGKSFTLIHLAMCIVHGLPFAGFPVEQGSVLYLAGEGHGGYAARFRAWKKHHAHLGLEDDGRYCVVSSEIPTLNTSAMKVLDALMVKLETWKGKPPELVIIDTLSQGLDDDENDAKVVGPVIRALMAIRKRWGCTIIIAHHLVKMNTQGKRKGQKAAQATRDSIRGSGALTRNVDTVLGLISDDDGGVRSLYVWKQKDGSKIDPVEMWLHQVGTGAERLEGQPETSCIMLPDSEYQPEASESPPAAAVEDPSVANPAALQQLDDAIQRVVATLKEMGAVDGGEGAATGREIAAATGIRYGLSLAGVRGAARQGLIRDVGTKRSAQWLVVEKPTEPTPQDREG